VQAIEIQRSVLIRITLFDQFRAVVLPLDANYSIAIAQQAVQVGPATFATLVKPQPIAAGGVK